MREIFEAPRQEGTWDRGIDYDLLRKRLLRLYRRLREKAERSVRYRKRLALNMVLMIQLRNGCRVSEAVEALKKVVPGKWIFLSKSGYASWVTSPPPLSLRIPEPKSPEEAKRISQMIVELVPRRKLREEFNAARRLYKYWLARARYLRDELEEDEGDFQEELPPPETMILTKISRKFALFMKSFEMAPLDGQEKFVFNLSQPGHWVRKRWGEKAQSYVISSALRAMLRSKNNRIQLRIAGFRFFEDTERKLLGDVDVSRYKAHMQANGHKYDRVIGTF